MSAMLAALKVPTASTVSMTAEELVAGTMITLRPVPIRNHDGCSSYIIRVRQRIVMSGFVG